MTYKTTDSIHIRDCPFYIFGLPADDNAQTQGYPRIGLPEKSYRLSDTAFPYQFEYPIYSHIEPATGAEENLYWINIVFPAFKGKLYLSYKPLNGNLRNFTEDTRNFVMKHTRKPHPSTN